MPVSLRVQPLFYYYFLSIFNDLTDNISSQMRLFPYVGQTHEKLVNDLKTVSMWADLRKMVFNPDITKQANEIIFSVKKDKPVHPVIELNGVPVARHAHTHTTFMNLPRQWLEFL